MSHRLLPVRFILPWALSGCEGNLTSALFFLCLLLCSMLVIGLVYVRKKLHASHLQQIATEKNWQDEKMRLQKSVSSLQEQQTLASLYWHHMLEELRTPLHGIQGFLHLSLQAHYGPLSPQLAPVLQTCLQLSDMLRQDLEGIAILTESQDHWLNVRASRYPLEQLLKDLDPFLDLQKQRNIELRFQLKKLWSMEQREIVQDIPKLLLVLRQILNHAFSQARNRQQAQLTLALQYRNRLLTIELSLEGAPLQTDLKIESHHTPLTPHLPLALAFLKWLGGELREQHHPELGYRWTILLADAARAELLSSAPARLGPDILPRDPLPSQVHSMPQTFHLDWSGESPHILVVDDQALNCELIREILMPHGYRVSIAFGGREGLRKMQDLRPNLVLLDLMMPDCTGEDVLREKQNNPSLSDIPVILITARASDQDRLFGLDLGADDFLAKPIAPEELLLRVKNLLQRLRLTRQLALFESREEHALHGELLQLTARSILKSFAEQDSRDRLRSKALESLFPWVKEQALWMLFVEDCLAQKWQEDISPPQAYPLPNSTEPLDRWRDLRCLVLTLAWDESQKQILWQQFTETPHSWVLAFHSCLQTHCAILELAHRSERAKALLESLLSLESLATEDTPADAAELLELALQLFLPRFEELSLRLEKPKILSKAIPAGSSQNTLLLYLYLLSYLCDQLAQVHRDDKWLSLSWLVSAEQLELCLQHGGPLLSQQEGEELFSRNRTLLLKDQHRMQGLFEARRLAQLCQGSLSFQTDKNRRQLQLILPLSPGTSS